MAKDDVTGIKGPDGTYVISATPGGSAEIMIRSLSNNSAQGENPKNRRIFGDWDRGVCLGKVICHTGVQKDVILKIGADEGFVIIDDLDCSRKRKFSYKPRKKLLKIGTEFVLGRSQLEKMPSQIIADMIVNTP